MLLLTVWRGKCFPWYNVEAVLKILVAIYSSLRLPSREWCLFSIVYMAVVHGRLDDYWLKRDHAVVPPSPSAVGSEGLASRSSCSWTTGSLSSSTLISRLRVTDSLVVRLAVLLASKWTRGTCGQDTLAAVPGRNTRVAFLHSHWAARGEAYCFKMLPCDWLPSTGLGKARKVVRIVLKWFKVKTKIYY